MPMKGKITKPNKENIYQLIIVILTTAFILSIVGWLQANKKASRLDDIKTRLVACQNLEDDNEYEICSDAVDDLRAEISVYYELLRGTGIN